MHTFYAAYGITHPDIILILRYNLMGPSLDAKNKKPSSQTNFRVNFNCYGLFSRQMIQSNFFSKFFSPHSINEMIVGAESFTSLGSHSMCTIYFH